MNGLGILLLGAAGAVVVIGFAVFLRWEDARDDRAHRRDPFPRQPEHTGFADIERPPGIAHEPPRRSIHELPALGDAVWHQYPVTSPAAGVATGAPAGPGPGTAAAAGSLPPSPPAAAPPPLPDPAYAHANPTAYPLEWLLSDTFVGGLTAIRGGDAQ